MDTELERLSPLLFIIKSLLGVLAGAAQLVGALSMHWKVMGLIPHQGTSPPVGARLGGNQSAYLSHQSFSLSPVSSLCQI